VTITADGRLGYDSDTALFSTRRLKTDIRPLEDMNEAIFKLTPVRYTNTPDGKSSIGLIAEEMYEVFPELTPLDAEGLPARVLYDRLVAVLIKQVQYLTVEMRLMREEYDGEIEDMKALFENQINEILSKSGSESGD
jgi:hypothetical protein